MRCALALLWLVLIGCDAGATAAAAEASSDCIDCGAFQFDDPAFESVGDGNAIKDNVVSALAQDRHGFLWIGTPGGLLRYSGYRFRDFSGKSSRYALDISFVRTLMLARDGRLWIGSESDGLAMRDSRDGTFTRYRSDGAGALPVGSVRALAEAADGSIWIGQIGGGLSRLDPTSGRVEIVDRGEDGEALDTRVQALLVDAADDLWIGTWDGLYRRRASDGSIEMVDHGEGGTTLLDNQIITALFQSQDGMIWVGTQSGQLFRIDPRTNAKTLISGSEETAQGRHSSVYALLQVDAETLWIARDSGIEIRASSDGRLLRRLRHHPLQPTGLASNEIRALLRDQAGWIWIGGYGAGLQRHNPASTAFGVRRADAGHGGVFVDPNVRSVIERSNGEIWAGTQERGIAIFDSGLHLIGAIPIEAQSGTGLGSGRVSGLAESSDGTVWIGSDSGLHRRAEEDGSLRRFGGIQGRIRRLLVTADDTLWVASEDGLYRLLPRQQHVERIGNADGSVLSGDINAIAEGADGELWVGSETGLLLLDERREALQVVQPLPGQELTHTLILGLLADSQAQLWIDTPAGLHRMRQREGLQAGFEPVGHGRGVSERPFGANLLQDDRGRIWSHLHVYTPKDGSLYELSRADGIDIGTGWFRAYTRTRNGRMLFGGSRGLLVVDPDRFTPSTYSPPLVVSELKIDGQTQPFAWSSEPLVLSPDVRSFSIEIAALDYSAPQRLRYARWLQGFDQDWIETDANFRLASYSNLAPGNYLLKARGSNRNGDWSPHELAIPIKVRPNWWQTWWLRSLAVLLAVAVLMLLVQLRTAYLRQRQRLLELKVQQRTQELEEVSRTLQIQSRALEEVSVTDPLTGLRNRRFLTRHLESDTALSLRQYERHDRAGLGNPDDADLIFFLLDIDHFKQVNDRYGHSAGDSVLLQMRSRLESVFRDSDYLVRWGGEEFLIVARATSRDFALELAERARVSVSGSPFRLDDGSELKKTCSIGFASFPLLPERPRALDWTAVVDLADFALYCAKRAGRDGTVGISAGAGLPVERLAERLKSETAPLLLTGQLAFSTSFDREHILSQLRSESTAG